MPAAEVLARRPKPLNGVEPRVWTGPTVALALAATAAGLYLALAPPAADLAAATYRSDLFAKAGLTAWDAGWYAAHGHWLPAYSLLSPALGALLGVRLLLALSAALASVLFGAIATRAFGARAGRVAAGVFALGVCVGMLSGRVPFELGLAIGLGSVLALMEGRLALALGLAALASLASPVAGAFLALAGLAVASGRRWGSSDAGRLGSEGDPPSARQGLALSVAAIGPALGLGLAYPEGGYEPFAASAFWPALGGVVLVAVLLPQGQLGERGRRTVRVGAGLYALALVASFAIHTPMGGNAARLGALLAAPVVAGAMWDSRRMALAAVAPILLYWQLVTPIRDYATIAGDPSVHPSYYSPLRAELRRLDGREPTLAPGGRRGAAVVPGARQGIAAMPGRPGGQRRATIVEVPLTRAHWEAAYLAGHDGVALARGWERQLDLRYASLFYRPRLSAPAYERWLAQNRVRYVALPDAPLDRAGHAEGALVAGGLPYLREIWTSAHWRLYGFIG